MTTVSAASRLQDASLLGIGAGVVAVAAAGYVCKWAGFDNDQATAVMGLAIGVPPAVELQIKRRRRDTNVDIARIQRGELRRPVALVVMLLAAAILLLDTAMGYMKSEIQAVLQHFTRAGENEISSAKVVAASFTTIVVAIFGMCLFLVASYASQYFAKRPYLWTTTAVGCALAVRELAVLTRKSGLSHIDPSLAHCLVSEAVGCLGVLFICMVGVRLGRRYHDAFLAKRLARMEDKAAGEVAKQDQSAPQSQTTVDSPNNLPSVPDNHRTSDPINQIERLAHLRDTRALTEEEFQAKKTEILARI